MAEFNRSTEVSLEKSSLSADKDPAVLQKLAEIERETRCLFVGTAACGLCLSAKPLGIKDGAHKAIVSAECNMPACLAKG